MLNGHHIADFDDWVDSVGVVMVVGMFTANPVVMFPCAAIERRVCPFCLLGAKSINDALRSTAPRLPRGYDT